MSILPQAIITCGFCTMSLCYSISNRLAVGEAPVVSVWLKSCTVVKCATRQGKKVQCPNHARSRHVRRHPRGLACVLVSRWLFSRWACTGRILPSVGKMPWVQRTMYDVRLTGPLHGSLQYWTRCVRASLSNISVGIWGSLWGLLAWWLSSIAGP